MGDFELRLPCGIRIARELTEAQLVAALPDVAASRSVKGAGWVWYRLAPFREAEVEVDIALAFQAGALQIIEIADVDERFGKTWDDASEASERERAASIGAWLGGKGIRPGSLSWGCVTVGYDARAGVGSATIRFAS